ncbi:DUF4164 family protein [Phenylobacterium sp.]|uniref:DUF4164 family protein n=1 Tax=Phenylobacterium sp. TaxID=1871053 RepID=UPI0027337365|nr:DUF4164 family protein [Phenylobacterium sp.]MDP3661230.1 DUF4164 family protein [Phenylobacterium sp.]
MIREAIGENALDQAARRLERAVTLLEQQQAQRVPSAEAETDAAFAPDRAALAAELDQARARERQLEEAGAEASAALGRAITEIRAALDGQTPSEPTET